MIVALLLALIKITALAVLSYGFLRLSYQYYKFLTDPVLNTLPSPPRKSFIFGNVVDNMRAPFMANNVKLWGQLCEKAGERLPIMAIHMCLGVSSVWCYDPDVVKEIMIAPAHKDPSLTEKRYMILSNLLGTGLLTMEGGAWHRHRRILQPAFHAGAIKDAVGFSAWKRTQELIAAWKMAEPGRVIDACSHMSALTLDTIGDVAFGHDFKALDCVKQWASDPSKTDVAETTDPLIHAFNELLSPRLLDVLAAITTSMWFFKLNPTYNHLVNVLNKAVDDVIAKGRENATSSEPGKTNKKTMIKLMFDAEDKAGTSAESKRLSYNEIRDELKTFIYVGHDTTSVATHWALYCLGRYPDIQQKVYDDICKHSTTDEDVNLESIEKMTYFVAFINEVLRMFPPVGFLGRVLTKEVTWKGYTLPAETRVTIPILTLHRHPDFWEKPDTFWPERWLDVEATEKRHPFAYIPFSAGGRNCIGQSFALSEAKLITSLICRNFHITLPKSWENRELHLSNFTTLKNNPGLEVCVKAR